MPGQSSILHVRVDNERATAALDAMGLTISEAVRLFLHRVVAEQAFPFELKAPNSETRAAMAEAEEIPRSRRARFKNSEELMASLEKPRKNKRTGAREPTPSV